MLNSTSIQYIRLPAVIANENDRERLNTLVTRIWRNNYIYQIYDRLKAQGKTHNWACDELAADCDLSATSVDTILRASGRKPRKKKNPIIEALI